jgi:hypothetical protein
VLGYEILTGRRPFRGDDAVTIAYAIAHTEATPPSEVNPELPREFDEIWKRALAKDPSERFAGAKEFHEALAGCLAAKRGEPSHLELPQARRRARMRFGALAGVLIVSALGVSLLSRKGSEAEAVPPPPAPKTAVAPAPKPAAPAAAVPKPVAPPAKSAPAPKAVAKPGPAPKAAAPAAAKPVAKAAAKPKAAAPVAAKPVAKANVTISLTHRVKSGTLIVSLDGKPILSEEIAKKGAFPDTVTWETIQAPAGKHRITATLRTYEGQTFVAAPYAIELAGGEAVALRFQLKNDLLMLKDTRG